MRSQARSERLSVERRPVGGVCPECGAEELAEYHVNSEQGWQKVVKCQRCLFSVSREPWGLYGPLSMLAETIEGAGR